MTHIPTNTYDWTLLNGEYRDVIQRVADDWTAKINAKLPETDYQGFLVDHAGLFFSGDSTFITISQLELADDWVTDFVVVTDQGSNGLQYELIEIETPDKAPYTKSGRPSQYLSQAIQQVQDWKRWIADHGQLAAELLPSKRRTIEYTVIIGNRPNSEESVEKRNAYAKDLEIRIRSFDYLTAKLLANRFSQYIRLNTSLGTDMPEPDIVNQLLNPFCCAMSHSEWKAFLHALERHGMPAMPYHFTANNVAKLVAHRKYNDLNPVFQERHSKDGHQSLVEFPHILTTLSAR